MFLLDKALKGLVRHGTLTVTEAGGARHVYGQERPGWPNLGLRFTDDKAPNFIARNPRLGAGEAYMDGRFVVEGGDIMDFVRFISANNPRDDNKSFDRDESNLVAAIKGIAARLDRVNERARSRSNVAHHYDLGDQLYELFLDGRRQYSCAYWRDPEHETLEQAQANKLAHIAAKLNLEPGMRVLDIGCGWGGMARYLHKVAGVEVLGVTLSEEQLSYARATAAAEGVGDNVRFELIDYRDVTGTFDRIVSVGMFEHVGPKNYEEFFRTCYRLLPMDGVMLLHSIGRMGAPGVTDAWTRKYIFPGGYSPSASEVIAASEKSGLILSDVEGLRLHYFYTLVEWYKRVVAHRDAIVALYDERFYRMWTFYLAGAASSFESGGMMNYQYQYVKGRHATPITRDYMAEAEARYLAKDKL